MQLVWTDEQESFRDFTQRFITSETPLTAVRDLYDSADGFDRDWWRRAAELGWTSLLVPEAAGGGSLSGSPVADAAIAAEQIGRHVAPGPFLPVNLVAAALGSADAPSEVQSGLLQRLLTGEAIASWAHAEAAGRWDAGSVATTVSESAGQLVLDGTKSFVEAASSAEQFLVTARSADGLSLVLVPADAPGVTVVRGRSVDMTRRFGRVVLDHVEVPADSSVGAVGGADDLVQHLLQVAVALQCAELIGLADRTLEVTLEYGRDRFAFGRPIVSFQALKHRIAEMTVWLEGSKAVATELASAIDGRRRDAQSLASVAKAYVGERCVDIIDDCVQITGGIAVTWEHDIHLYSRRAVLDRALYGSPEEHKYQLLAHLEGAVA